MGCGIIFWIFLFFYFVVGNRLGNFPVYIFPISSIVFFVSIGLLNCIGGTILSGVTLSLCLHAYFSGAGVDYIFIWKDIFEFVEVKYALVKYAILIVSVLMGSVEIIFNLEK